jgi:hypothetical protein
MKKTSLILLMLCLAIASVDAQSSKSKSKSKKKQKEETSFFKEKLWYGGSFNLGFSGQQGYSVFQFGLAPMVGYKFTSWLSAGPRLAPTYISVKGPSNVGQSRANIVDFEYGLFTRLKVYNAIYLQGEAGKRSIASPLFGNVGSDGKVPTIRTTRTDYLVGGGYCQSADGGWASDISILYNIAVANDINNVYESPLVFRFGLTYNF